MFATAVKIILVPAQIARRNVAWRTLGFMLLGGVPGVILGSLFLKHLVNAGSQNLMNAILGTILVTTSAWQIFVYFRPMRQNPQPPDHSGAHWFSHASNTELLFHLIEGGVVGAIAGTLLSTRVPRRQLRFALWVWLLILGGQFLFNSYEAWATPHKLIVSQSQQFHRG